MADKQTFTKDQVVAFTTPGRFPRDHTGVVVSSDSAFVIVKCADGETRKSRPGATRAA
jgi:hypothetical protein